MPGIPAKYRETFARLRRATDHLHNLIESGEFHALGYLERRKLIARVRRLYNRLVGPVSPRVIAGALAAAGVLSLAGCWNREEPPQVPDFTRVDATTIGLGGYELYVNESGFLALADLDGDGDLDIYYADNYFSSSDRYITVQLNDGTGHFGAKTRDPYGLEGFHPPGPPYWDIRPLTFVDIDDDGDLDMLGVGDYFNYVAPAYNNVASVFMQTNGGSPTEPDFGPPLAFAYPAGLPEDPDAPDAAQFVDIDGDGDLDLITVVSGGTAFNSSYVYLTPNTSGSPTSFTAAADSTVAFPYGNDELVETALQGLAVTDLDKDGDLDIILGYYIEYSYEGDLTFRIQVLNNQSTEEQIQFAASPVNPYGISFPVRVASLSWTTEQRMSLAAGDIDNDGDIDLITGTYAQSSEGVPYSYTTEFFYFENHAADDLP
jgi:hypothetical protein